ncbi:Zinc finger protein bud20 [Lasiodiplodia hormozganensis]|uniref:Zinc finger protein bud20 n=1 Tax=Lasiodiplodia hormozganensis TaxID=869390 RepID=A0AA39YU19_9PEZI|nr:Zinc finger protein bud20 [Lasiodiplodia hormozganensis]
MPAIRGEKSKKKTRRYTRDVDQVYADLRSERHLQLYKETKAEEDLPALGKFYCTECAKWFESNDNLTSHQRGKPHKRRLRQLREEPHTQKESEAAVGLRSDNGTRTNRADKTGLSSAVEGMVVEEMVA